MVAFSGTSKASPQVIWDTCFKPMNWESWDIDIKGLLDVSGGCENGTSFKFHMNDDKKIPVVLSNVVEPESLTFAGKFLGGTVGVKGTIKLELQPDDGSTHVTYSFGLTGILGAVAGAAGATKIYPDSTI
ncbi:hypothetical protein ACA910_006802 [Epithemia clementina (nom. ined.)]